MTCGAREIAPEWRGAFPPCPDSPIGLTIRGYKNVEFFLLYPARVAPNRPGCSRPRPAGLQKSTGGARAKRDGSAQTTGHRPQAQWPRPWLGWVRRPPIARSTQCAKLAPPKPNAESREQRNWGDVLVIYLVASCCQPLLRPKRLAVGLALVMPSTCGLSSWGDR
jgi:hypothetical protein